MTKTERLDVLVLERGLVNTREAARTAIMDGAVLVNGQKVTKPGTKLKADSVIELIPSFAKPKYVSRGGLKLEKALREFAVDPADRICLDIGASTGGFTDCLLKHGARQVYAIDVGYGQLDYSLRTDRRVVVRERLNARYLTIDQIYGPPDDAGRLSGDDCMADLAVMDVSFISVTKII
ncbi:MAG TPA: TlyA family RNA methyltransferase, partial [Chroococcales cyanobacterium]